MNESIHCDTLINQDFTWLFLETQFLPPLLILARRKILFRQQSYPDQDHSIGRFTEHLYRSLTDFFENDCFKEKESRGQ